MTDSLYLDQEVMELNFTSKLKKAKNRYNICRLCFAEVDAVFSIKTSCSTSIPPNLDFNLTSVSVKEILQFYFGEVIHFNTGTSDGVCGECMRKLYKTYDFITYCRFTEGILKKWANKRNFDILEASGNAPTEPDPIDAPQDNFETVEQNIMCLNMDNDIFGNENINTQDVIETIDNYEKSKENVEVQKISEAKNSMALIVDGQIENDIYNGPHVCSTCQEGFNDSKSLVEHRKSHGTDKHQCVKCGKGLTTFRGLVIHMRQHYGARPEVCATCGASFTDPRSLKTHCATKHEGFRPYECSECGKRFAKKIPLELHLKTHTGDRPHVCDVCGKSYIQPHSLIVHKRLHSGEKPYSCTICLKAFHTSSSLKMHFPMHTGAKDYVCSICGKRMARSSELYVHMRIHNNQRPFECQTCGKTFPSSSALGSHTASHSGEKKHVCNICDKRYARTNDLASHLLTHTNERTPFNCRICSAVLSSRAALKRHQNIHTGEKRFKCSHCDRAFVASHSLKIHLRTHTGERPYACDICRATFAQAFTLKAHLKVHKNVKPAKPVEHLDAINGPKEVPATKEITISFF